MMSLGAFVASKNPFDARDVEATARRSVLLFDACVNGVVAENVTECWLLEPGRPLAAW